MGKTPKDRIRCDVCGYCNHKDFVKYTGVCHLCGKILDERAYFKQQMIKKMRLWKNMKHTSWKYGKDR